MEEKDARSMAPRLTLKGDEAVTQIIRKEVQATHRNVRDIESMNAVADVIRRSLPPAPMHLPGGRVVTFERMNDLKKMRMGSPEKYRVELYETAEGSTFPIAWAFVAVLPRKKNVAHLNLIIVADAWRRRGHGKALLEACIKQWPSLMITGPIDEAAGCFLRAVVPDRV